MKTQPNSSDDPLETLLRKASAPVPDDGFSNRVLAALPPPPPQKLKLPSRRTIAYAIGTLTGLLWAVAQPGSWQTSDFATLSSRMASFCTTVVSSLSSPSGLFVGTLILGSLAFAYFPEITEKFRKID